MNSHPSSTSRKGSKKKERQRPQKTKNAPQGLANGLSVSPSSFSPDSSEVTDNSAVETFTELSKCLDHLDREKHALTEENVKLKREITILKWQLFKAQETSKRVNMIARQEMDKIEGVMEQQKKETVDAANAKLDKLAETLTSGKGRQQIHA